MLYTQIVSPAGDRFEIQMMRMMGSPEPTPLPFPNARLASIGPQGEIALILNPRRRGFASVGTLARAPMAGGGAPE